MYNGYRQCGVYYLLHVLTVAVRGWDAVLLFLLQKEVLWDRWWVTNVKWMLVSDVKWCCWVWEEETERQESLRTLPPA